MTSAPNSLLAAALVKARSEMHAIAKDSVNPAFKSKYASLEAWIETTVPILNQHDLTLVQGVVAPDRDEHGKLTAFTVRTTLLHVSGETLVSDVVMPVAKCDPQGVGAAITYGRRYGLSMTLGLATDEDDDGNSASASRGKAVTQQRKPAAAYTPNGQAVTSAAPVRVTAPEDRVVKGKDGLRERLGDMDELRLVGILEWSKSQKPERVKALVADVEAVLESRRETVEATA